MAAIFAASFLFTFSGPCGADGLSVFPKPAANAPATRTSRLSNSPRSSRRQRRLKLLELLGALARPASLVLSQPSATAETSTTIENEKFRITFSNKGAQVAHWILKGFTESSGKPLDMVQEQAASRFGLPLSLFTYDNGLTTQLNTALYQPSATRTLPGAKLRQLFHYAAGRRCTQNLQLH